MTPDDLSTALEAARAGADVVGAGFHESFTTEMKGSVDPVTAIDRAAEEAIRAVLARLAPEDRILGEEGGGADWRSERVWIVDPLDGTVNFVNRIPQVAVSVALWDRSRPLVGVVIDVVRREEFAAEHDKGATLGGHPVTVSATAELEDSVLATGFPYDRRRHADAYLKAMGTIMRRSRGTRRMGAAALDMAWVACGRFDGYWEHGGPQGVKPWDAAAGMLLVEEAGGMATDNKGAANNLSAPAFVVSNGRIHDDLRRLVDEHMPEHLL